MLCVGMYRIAIHVYVFLIVYINVPYNIYIYVPGHVSNRDPYMCTLHYIYVFLIVYMHLGLYQTHVSNRDPYMCSLHCIYMFLIIYKCTWACIEQRSICVFLTLFICVPYNIYMYLGMYRTEILCLHRPMPDYENFFYK
jgi:hypothetical protein